MPCGNAGVFFPQTRKKGFFLSLYLKKIIFFFYLAILKPWEGWWSWSFYQLAPSKYLVLIVRKLAIYVQQYCSVWHHLFALARLCEDAFWLGVRGKGERLIETFMPCSFPAFEKQEWPSLTVAILNMSSFSEFVLCLLRSCP